MRKQTNNKQTDKKNKQKQKSEKQAKDPKQKEEASQKEPEKPRTSPCVNLREALLKTGITVREGSDLQYLLTAQNVPINPRVGWNNTTCGHPVTHCLRTHATHQAIAEMVGDFKTATIIDWYGSDRKPTHLPTVEPGVALDLRNVRPAVYAGDLCRSGAKVVLDAPITEPLTYPIRGVLFMDIYQDGKFTEPLTPQTIADVIVRYGCFQAIVIMRNLSEAYGAEIFRASVGSGEERRAIVSAEGRWESHYSNGVWGQTRSVLFAPDEGTPPYPCHPFVHINLTGATEVSVGSGTGWLHTHPMSRVGPYTLTKCVLSPQAPLPVGPVIMPDLRYSVQYRGFAEGSWAAFLDMMPQSVKLVTANLFAPQDATLGDRPTPELTGLVEYRGAFPVDHVLASTLCTVLNFSAINGRVLSSLVSKADAELDRIPAMMLYPRLRTAILFNTIAFITVDRVDTPVIEALRLAHNPVLEQTRKEILTGKMAPVGWLERYWTTQPFLAKCGIVLGAGLAAGALVWLTKGRARAVGPAAWAFWALTKDTANAGLNLVAAQLPAFTKSATWNALTSVAHARGVVLEEVFKWLIPHGGLVFGLLEGVTSAWHHVHSGGTVSQAIALRAPALLMHMGTGALYAKLGAAAIPFNTAIHFAFNFATAGALWHSASYQEATGVSQEALDQGMSMVLSRSQEQAHVGPAGWWPTVTEYVAWLLKRGRAPSDLPGDALEWFRASWINQTSLNQSLVVYPGQGTRQVASPVTSWWTSTVPKEWRWSSLCVSMGASEVRIAFNNPPQNKYLSKMLEWTDVQCVCNGFNTERDACHHCSVCPPSDFAYVQLQTSGTLHKPTSSPAATLAALAARWFNDPDGHRATVLLEATWLANVEILLEPTRLWFAEAFRGLQSDRDWYSVEECASLMPANKGALLLSAEEYAQFYGALAKSAIQAKVNEQTKGAYDLDQGCYTQKPRAIINIHPTVQARLLPVSRLQTDMLKERFDGSIIDRVGRFQVSFIIADPTPENLRKYALYLTRGDVMTILVSCDDTAVSTGPYSGELGAVEMETDFTEFDQSQHRAFSLIDSQLPAPQDWHALHDDVMSAPVMSKRVNLERSGGSQSAVRILAQLRWAMRTGLATTSIYGSVHNLASWVYWLLERSKVHPQEQELTYAYAAKEIGLTAKVIMHQQVGQMTFLRGVFLNDSWNILPSLCLKLGKSMVAPSSRIRSQYADILFFNAVCLSVDVPLDYPILGAYKQLSAKLMRAIEPDRRHTLIARQLANDPTITEDARYKVRTGTASRNEVLHFILKRYDLSAHEIEEAEKLILSVDTLPALVAHHVFERMRDIDYQ